MIELASAGLIPSVADAPERNGYTLDQHGFEGRLANLVEREGADTLLAQARLASEVLPSTSFPVPAAAVAVMEAGLGPRP
nr:hypothetical protein [Methylobacterium sp. L1A1]